jgi:ferrochelatase
MKATRGLLLVNLGTPAAPTVPAVRRYLREFLSDPRVIDLPAVPRWLLLNLFILPFRPRSSARAYRKVWTDRGSPLLAHSEDLARAVAGALGGGTPVELAMRYGQPSIEDAVARLRARGAQALTVFPLYPQYAASSTGSTLARVYQVLAEGWDPIPVSVVPPFHGSGGFLDAFAEVARPVLSAGPFDHVLFSFHGLPERQIRKSEAPPGGFCLAGAGCCEAVGVRNACCYRAQCFETARQLAGRLGLPPDRHSVSFQSRLGRTKWIEPYTDHVIPALARRGAKHLAVICPSFVADCLETLEEIGLRGAEAFRTAGGERLTLVPSLNAHPIWVETVVQLARDASR